MGKIDALVQQKIDSDAEFQNSLADLSDEDKEAKVKEKRTELLENEFDNLSKEKDKNKELADNYKIRAEKAERTSKKPENAGGDEPPKKDVLSTKDILVISKANVHEDDIDWVIAQSEITKKSIAEVLKDEEVKAVLKLRDDKRKTADASNTTTARSGSRKPDGSVLARELSAEGKVPEPGSDEAEELFWARRGGKKN